MKKLKLLAFVFAGFAFAMVSCSKGSGTTGPAGPAGPAGPSGTGSVTYSPWITLNMTLETDANNDSAYFQAINAPAITQEIIDSGVILSYIQNVFANDGSIVEVGDFATFLDVNYNVGVINLTAFGGGFDLSGAAFRYVVIPGSVAAGNSILKGYTKAQLKAANYSVIAKALGITDTKNPN